jgi:cobalt-zinc-cadmium efflux system outer membrane protein
MVGVSSGRGPGPLATLFACGSLGGKTDAELLDLFASGEAAEAAFETLVIRHGPDVLRACRRVLADPNDADDAFQATFLVLARRASSRSIGRPESLAPWLHGVALRVARKARVAAARRRRHEGRIARQPDAGSPQPDGLSMAVRDEVDRLPEPLRTPVVLCYLEDMTYRGAARSLRVSEGTIRGRLVKARSLLRARLAGHAGVAVGRHSDVAGPRARPARVPPALAAATGRAAMSFAPGGAGIPGVSAAVAELMEGVLTMTILTRWIIGATAVAALGLAAAGGAAMAAKGDDQPSATKAVAPATDDSRKGDPNADPRPTAVLSLDAAIDRLLRNTDAEAARLEIPRARAEQLTASLRANSGSYAESHFAPSGDDRSLRPGGPTEYDINMSHPLDYSHKRRARTHSAGTANDVAEAQYQDAVRNWINQLYELYVDVQEAQERARWTKEDVRRWEELLRETKSPGGQKGEPDLDREQILSILIRARQRRFEAKVSLRHTKDVLSMTLGRLAEESDRLEVERLRFADRPIPPIDSLTRLALDTRPDLTALRIGVTRAGADLHLATRNGDAYVLYQPYASQDKPRTDRETGASWALGATYPLPLYNRNQGNIQRARINLQQTQTQLASKERSIVKEVRERHQECGPSHAEFREILIGLQRHRRAFLEAEERYRNGEGKPEDVVRAGRELETSETQYLDRLARHRRNVLALNTAVGMRLFP